MNLPIYTMRAVEEHATPECFYARLVQENPVHYSPEGYWVVSRYSDVRALLSSKVASAGYHRFSPKNEALPRPFQRTEVPWLVNLDGAQHERLRTALEPLFSGAAIAGLTEIVRELSSSLVERIIAEREADIVSMFAYPLPAMVIMRLFGISGAHWEQVRGWFPDRAAIFDTAEHADPTLEARCRTNRDHLLKFFKEQFGRVDAASGDTLIAALRRSLEQGALRDRDELLANAVLLLFAGYETTQTLIGNSVQALLKAEIALEQLRDPGFLRSFIEEVLRFSPPTSYTQRVLSESCCVGGVELPAGSYLRLLLCAANRDPQQFAEPNRFDPLRKPNQHLAFGYGPHFCLGARLARLETTIALETLAHRCERVELIEENPPVKDRASLPSLARLRVRVHPCASVRAASGTVQPMRCPFQHGSANPGRP